MVARLVKQDDTLRKEFLKRIQAKVEAEKELLTLVGFLLPILIRRHGNKIVLLF